MSRSDRLAEAWAALSALELKEHGIRVEPAGISVPLGEVLVGIDRSGGLHLLVPTTETITEDRRSVGVQLRIATLEHDGTQADYLDAVCLSPHLNDLFVTVATEMLEAVNSSPDAANSQMLAVLSRWRELLDRPRGGLLGPDQLAGLFAELTVLEGILERGVAGLGTWVGPERKQQDFLGSAWALEVKASSVREGRSVEIHGVTQLVPPEGKTLALVYIRLDPEPDGTSVPDLVRRIDRLPIDRETFRAKLAQAGYDPSRADDYSRPLLRVVEQRFYLVTEGFPRIVEESFVGGIVPPGVTTLRYRIDLTGEPPAPLAPEEVDQLLDSLAATR